MGFVKRGVFKNKGSGKGNLWESSRTPLHLAYTYDQSDPSHSLVFMRLRVAPRDAPSLLGMHHGHYDVNLYHMPELPSRHLSWRSRDVSSRALAAFDAAVKMVRDKLRDKRIYVLRKRGGASTMYCEVWKPDRSSRRAYRPALSAHTCHGAWQILMLDFDERHADCRRASLKWWKNVKDLKGHDAVEAALRYALGSCGGEDVEGRCNASASSVAAFDRFD